MTLLTLWLACAAAPTSGELGRIDYGLLPSDDAADRALVTGHPVAVWVALTAVGEAEAGDRAAGIRHGADRGTLTNIPYADAPADFRLVVADPGEVEVTSTLDGELFDRVALRFAAPAALVGTPLVEVGGRWAEDGDVPLGGRVSIAVRATDADGELLGGELATDLAFDPPGSFVPDASATGPGGAVWVAAERGDVSLTVTDPVNGVSDVVDLRVR